MKTNKIFLTLLVMALIVGGYWLADGQDSTKSIPPETPLVDIDVNNQQVHPPSKTSVKQTSQAEPANNQSPKRPSPEFFALREALTQDIQRLLKCHLDASCPSAAQASKDPRADHFLRAKKLADKLIQYRKQHLDEGYFDEKSQQMVQDSLAFADGLVQQEAIHLMSSQAPNLNNAKQLIEQLKTSFDAKIMRQSMLELQRYPSLQGSLDSLFQQSLQTGSFYVAREVAANIQTYLNPNNIDSYQALAEQLPARSKRARLLRQSIQAYRLSQVDQK